MKYVLLIICIIILVLLGILLIKQDEPSVVQGQSASAGHVYASWDIMEFDKCVAAWLITRFIDKNAQFIFYPQGTEIKEGIVFDVPGAEWSRKHRKCTSQCVLESIKNPDPAVQKIVSFAGKTELNFWQLDRWPEAQKRFYEVKEIMDNTPNPAECFRKTNIYFDALYDIFEKDILDDSNDVTDECLRKYF